VRQVHDVTWRIEWASCVKLSDRDRQVASRAYDDAQSAICQIPYRLGIVTTAAWTGSCYEVKSCGEDKTVVAHVIESSALVVPSPDAEPNIPRGTEVVATGSDGSSTRWIVTGCYKTWMGVKKSTWWRRLYWRLRRFLCLA
jgi:hypothetical protein